jgi:hypothetical protein
MHGIPSGIPAKGNVILLPPMKTQSSVPASPDSLTVGTTKFARTGKLLTSSVVDKTGSANGTYKVLRNGILFSNAKGEPFAWLSANRDCACFFVSCSKSDGKIRYMHALSSVDAQVLGVSELSWSDQRREAARVWALVSPPSPAPVVAPAPASPSPAKIAKERAAGLANGKIDAAESTKSILTLDNERKAAIGIKSESPLVRAYWEGWLEGWSVPSPAAPTYHPDPEINAEVTQEAREAEITDVKGGYPPARWFCPKCGASHARGHFQALGTHRCLSCGYVGEDGVLVSAPAAPCPSASHLPLVAPVGVRGQDWRCDGFQRGLSNPKNCNRCGFTKEAHCHAPVSPSLPALLLPLKVRSEGSNVVVNKDGRIEMALDSPEAAAFAVDAINSHATLKAEVARLAELLDAARVDLSNTYTAIKIHGGPEVSIGQFRRLREFEAALVKGDAK